MFMSQFVYAKVCVELMTIHEGCWCRMTCQVTLIQLVYHIRPLPVANIILHHSRVTRFSESSNVEKIKIDHSTLRYIAMYLTPNQEQCRS